MADFQGAEAFWNRVSLEPMAKYPQHNKKNWKLWPKNSKVPSYSALPDMEFSTRPELEDPQIMHWGIKESAEEKEPPARVDVLWGKGADLQWRFRVSDEDLVVIASEEPPSHPLSGDKGSFRAFFIHTLDSDYGWLRGNFSIRPATLKALRKAGLSTSVLASIYSSEGFWAKLENQNFVQYDTDKRLKSFEFAYRYICGWDRGVSYIHFLRTEHTRTYFCINYPSRAREKITAYLKRYPEFAYRDFFLDAVAADDCLKEWHLNIGERRESVLHHERKYEDEAIDFNTATRQLHSLARDWHTLEQGCSILQTQLGFLRQVYEKYISLCCDSKNAWSVDVTSTMGESLDALRSRCDNYTKWTMVYRDRTTLRINLLFHLASQREARTSTSIAASNKTIAEQTRRDSASMITIAAVTMLFLPGTFVSAILSTTFFDYGKDGLSVSGQWWILPAVTLPLMILVFGVWWMWQWWRFVGWKRGRVEGKAV
ncbi:hypothetical protein M011DRAFT_527898 [Sporormia fimetaria CBS 119925]|uniref:Cora-domain-containing protein n=1 Tax=Sporormia fimetaria CBS 119925 TaxID=1340428 RepID=A0A6A6V738_9PLEO|nr:hypothetical protein M011DRAFT_527898 [Sporormia fimetaria CBS 119925]